jgi:translation initiation factor IF-3
MPISAAISHAESKGLDLVEVAPNANPNVCKVMDYGKYRYEQSKREKLAKKRQKQVKIKELRIRPKIAEHDFQFIKRHIEKFIEEGSKAKVTVAFWGREISHIDIGQEKLDRLSKELADVCDVEQSPKLEGRNMVMILTPKS